MEESNYKHNYEYLSIEEAKSIIGGTFVQGTTNIGGELATKADIDKLLTAADKKLTSIVPVTDTSNEFICFFECISNETFPDDLEHRWIEVSPIQFTFPADGGSVKITGSYGLTGTLGTRKKVGDIADTITAGANATPSTKNGSKIYHYNNDQSQTPTAKVSWTQDARSVIAPTSVHVTNIILQVGQNQQIQYEVTPSNADVDTCTYEVTSGSDYVHITDGVVYADAAGKADCKITINGTIESTFQVSVINGSVERHNGDVFIIQRPVGGGNVIVDLHSPEYCINPITRNPNRCNNMIYNAVYVQGVDHNIWGARRQTIIDIDQIRKTYKQIKNKPSLIKGKTIEQACEINGGHYAYIYIYSDSYVIDSNFNKVEQLKCRAYKKSNNSSISFDTSSAWVTLKGYSFTSEVRNINNLTYGALIGYWVFNDKDWSMDDDYEFSDYFSRCGTLFSYLLIDLDQDSEISVFDFVSSNNGYIEKGYNVSKNDDGVIEVKEMAVDYTQNSLDTTGDYAKLNITINKINNSTDISNLRGDMVLLGFNGTFHSPVYTSYGTDSNGAFFNITDEQTLPYTTQINIPKKDLDKVQLYLSALNTDDSLVYRSAPIEITL